MTDMPIGTSTTYGPFLRFARMMRRHCERRPRVHDAVECCARRDFVHRMMSEDPTCVGTEYGVMGMMTMYPRDF